MIQSFFAEYGFSEYGQALLNWVEPWLPQLILLSTLMFFTTLILVPVVIVRMPASYFVAKRRTRQWTLVRILFCAIRNLIAFILLVAGLAMLILPGQGLLTILLAIAVSDVPGKYRLERWLLKQRGVLRSMNWIRRRYNRPLIKSPDEAP